MWNVPYNLSDWYRKAKIQLASDFFELICLPSARTNELPSGRNNAWLGETKCSKGLR